MSQEVVEVEEAEVTNSISLQTLQSVWETLLSAAWQEALVGHLEAKLHTLSGTSSETSQFDLFISMT